MKKASSLRVSKQCSVLCKDTYENKPGTNFRSQMKLHRKDSIWEMRDGEQVL